jgi:hypothetical protein
MTLYHGSSIVVREPRLQPLVRALDFGRAFYLTSDFDQASRWAKTTALRRGDGVATVSVYALDEMALSGLRVREFDGPTVEWLRFVSRNRNERIDDSGLDVVIGPVANDNTMPVLNLFFKGAYTEEEALRRLLPQRLKNQYAFKTARALACLSFVEAKEVS